MDGPTQRMIFVTPTGVSPVGRKCGDCNLCCRLVPVKELGKPGFQRCNHQRGRGCRIYEKRPGSCRTWSCLWYIGEGEFERPDRCHYVVDPMPDFIMMSYPGDEPFRCDVIQVWGDPAYREVIHDPALLAYVEKMNIPAFVRFDNKNDFVMVTPPKMSSTGDWFFRHPQPEDSMVEEHTLNEILRT